ncbi:transglycosylase, partial [Burkholderia sp. TJI49]
VTAAVTAAAAGGAKRVHATLDAAQPLSAKTTAPKAPQQADASVDAVKQAHDDHSDLGA